MATLTLTIPDEQVARIAAAYGYQATIKDVVTEEFIPNPETRGQFLKRVFLIGIIATVRQYEGAQAASAARAGVTEVTVT